MEPAEFAEIREMIVFMQLPLVEYKFNIIKINAKQSAVTIILCEIMFLIGSGCML